MFWFFIDPKNFIHHDIEIISIGSFIIIYCDIQGISVIFNLENISWVSCKIFIQFGLNNSCPNFIIAPILLS